MTCLRLLLMVQAYPKSNAVLVRRHGVYVWGPTWMAAKTQAECYDYLFEAAVRMRGMGIDASKPLAAIPASLANGQATHGATTGLCNGQESWLKSHYAFISAAVLQNTSL